MLKMNFFLINYIKNELNSQIENVILKVAVVFSLTKNRNFHIPYLIKQDYNDISFPQLSNPPSTY